jgi:hypothetical protein
MNVEESLHIDLNKQVGHIIVEQKHNKNNCLFDFVSELHWKTNFLLNKAVM